MRNKVESKRNFKLPLIYDQLFLPLPLMYTGILSEVPQGSQIPLLLTVFSGISHFSKEELIVGVQ